MWRSRTIPRYLWPPDKWERLSTTARLVGPARRVADVGGRGSEMARLLPSVEVVSLNVERPADVVVGRGPLPMEAGAVDVVTSTDVLEHLEPHARPGHVAELLRVARVRVVMCFPCGSPEKDAAEQAMARHLEAYGTTFAFLDEHLEHGLPRPAEVRDMVLAAEPGASVTLWFQNGIEERDAVLVDFLRARHGRDLRALVRFVRAWGRRPRPTLTTAQDVTSNRAYLVADLPPRVRDQPLSP